MMMNICSLNMNFLVMICFYHFTICYIYRNLSNDSVLQPLSLLQLPIPSFTLCKRTPTQPHFLLHRVCTFKMAFLCLWFSAPQSRVLPFALFLAPASRFLRWHQSPSSIHSSKSHKAPLILPSISGNLFPDPFSHALPNARLRFIFPFSFDRLDHGGLLSSMHFFSPFSELHSYRFVGTIYFAISSLAIL